MTEHPRGNGEILAIAKPVLGLQMTGSLGVHGRMARVVPPISATFEVVGGRCKIKARKFFAHATTPKQRVQRLKWCDADFMFRNLTLGQFALFKRYYWRERRRGRTLKESYHKTKTAVGTGARRDMGYYAYFMKRGLRWDLKEYLSRYLGSKWIIESVAPHAGGFLVKARLEHREAWRVVYEPIERSFIRGR